jgi:hypothetical protein
MTANKNLAKALGIAFLFQFITSVSSGVFLKPVLIVPGSISQTMINIANDPQLMSAIVLLDMLTAMGVVFLGVMLFVTLRKQNEAMALVALGLYVVEATLLAASQLAAFWLLRISEEYVAAGQPAYLQTMGNVAAGSMDFVGSTLHVLVFSLGAMLFYFLLYQSRLIPRVLSLWGLVTLIPILYGTVAAMFGYKISAVAVLPYVPFEFVVGLWILVKGLNVRQQDDILAMEPA